MFFNNLTELCHQKGISITQLALVLNISRSNVTNWKNGSVPKSDKIQKIAEYFNVSTDYLLGTEPKEKPLDEEIKFALFNGSDGITDEMYEEVKRFAELVKLREQQKGNK